MFLPNNFASTGPHTAYKFPISLLHYKIHCSGPYSYRDGLLPLNKVLPCFNKCPWIFFSLAKEGKTLLGVSSEKVESHFSISIEDC